MELVALRRICPSSVPLMAARTPRDLYKTSALLQNLRSAPYLNKGVEWGLSPGSERIESLFAFAVGPQLLAVHINAMGAPVDLGIHISRH
jgi:hypothetical protein